jgi:hypothetical protein
MAGSPARRGLKTARLNQVQTGQAGWDAAQQSVSTDFHLHQPGRFERPAVVATEKLVPSGP